MVDRWHPRENGASQQWIIEGWSVKAVALVQVRITSVISVMLESFGLAMT